jgi:hypothetical protein
MSSGPRASCALKLMSALEARGPEEHALSLVASSSAKQPQRCDSQYHIIVGISACGLRQWPCLDDFSKPAQFAHHPSRVRLGPQQDRNLRRRTTSASSSSNDEELTIVKRPARACSIKA